MQTIPVRAVGETQGVRMNLSVVSDGHMQQARDRIRGVPLVFILFVKLESKGTTVDPESGALGPPFEAIRTDMNSLAAQKLVSRDFNMARSRGKGTNLAGRSGKW